MFTGKDKLGINVPQEVNKEQWKHVKKYYRDYAAHRVEGGRYYIKFLTFAGLQSKLVREELLELE